MSSDVPPCPACHEVYAAKPRNSKGFVYWCPAVSSHDGVRAVTFNHGVEGSSPSALTKINVKSIIYQG